jgi:ankyrin repeat protein
LTAIDLFLGACLRADVADVRARVAQRPDLIASLTADDRQVIGNAIEAGHAESVSLMLDLGWSLTDESPWGGTPLHWASWYGRPSIVRLLLTQGRRWMRATACMAVRRLHGAVGSTFGRPPPRRGLSRVLDLLLDSGAERAASVNRWRVARAHGSVAVAARLRGRRFAV